MQRGVSDLESVVPREPENALVFTNTPNLRGGLPNTRRRRRKASVRLSVVDVMDVTAGGSVVRVASVHGRHQGS